MIKITSVLVLLCVVGLVRADLYLHNPPGCNDRNRERNENRNNGNRLFDSQNNAKGGYPYRGDPTVNGAPDPITYYTGSLIRFEWTNQHGCGPNPNVHCELVIQYACNTDLPGLRDGYPTGAIQESDNNNAGYKKRAFSGEAGQNADGTNTIPENQYANDPVSRQDFYYNGGRGGIEYGMHEGIDWYDDCKRTSRNKGLYTADQKVNRRDARGTRQNPNGNRRGLECPEERDYYPYWRPQPWKDIAVLVSDEQYCEYYTSKSQNVAPSGYCQCDEGCRNAAPGDVVPIDRVECNKYQGVWTTVPGKGLPKPECRHHSFGRDNHLGNTAMVNGDAELQVAFVQPETAHHVWRVWDDMLNKDCVFRFRYNMSTNDYPSHQFAENAGNNGVGFDQDQNCPRITQNNNDDPDADNTAAVDIESTCINRITPNSKPLYNRPYVDAFAFGADTTKRLSLAINTHQTGRTFQDRTYVFRVRARPGGVPTSKDIWNLNLRGRRGNIVQCYPSVEYDFVPSVLAIDKEDWIHWQMHGSDFNANRNNNNGEGWRYSDRTNVVQVNDLNENYPMHHSQVTLFDSLNIARRWALLDQTDCEEFYNGKANEQNSISNCGKLNRAPARFPPDPSAGLMEVIQPEGEIHYISTRNNNFSNRSQKARIIVGSTGLSLAAKLAIGFGVTAVVVGGVAGVLFYGKRHPNTIAGKAYAGAAGAAASIRGRFGGAPAATKTAGGVAPPDMEYKRHTGGAIATI